MTSVAFEIKPIIFGFSDKMDVRPCSINVLAFFVWAIARELKNKKSIGDR